MGSSASRSVAFWRLVLVFAVAIVFAVSIGGSPSHPPRASAGSLGISLSLLVGGLDKPVAITHAGDGSGRLFITLQEGKIVIWDGNQILPDPFLDISGSVGCCGEQGLLSTAFHPDYTDNGYFFVDYTDNSGDTVVARYTVSSDPDVADDTSAKVILTQDQPFSNHNGGQLQFGPDGYLYVAFGDGGSGGDPGNRAQDGTTLLGKILRIDVDVPEPGPAYAIPAGNPFTSNPDFLDEIWAYGLRNPWRFSFDRMTGDMLIGDVGQSAKEEVDFQAATSPGGENYGWRLMEGDQCYDPPVDCDDGSLIHPVLVYPHASGDCSITGGYRYRGASAVLAGVYVYGDLCSGRIWGGTESGGTWSASLLLDSPHTISTFGEDQDGELYVTDYDSANPTGSAVYRIIAPDDGDGDGVPNGADNCPAIANPLQENSDAMIGNGRGLPGIDATVPNGHATEHEGDACETDGDIDNDGIPDGSDATPGFDMTYDDDNDGVPGAGCLGGEDAGDDGPAWDANCDGRRDGLSPAFCSSLSTTLDADADGVRERYEVCKWGTSDSDTDSDGDGLTDCLEIIDVNGDGARAFLTDLLPYARAVQLPGAQYGKDGDFDFDGSNDLRFLTDLLAVARLIQLPPASGGCNPVPGSPNP
jgi:glucose/arabinose dehydrogenase